MFTHCLFLEIRLTSKSYVGTITGWSLHLRWCNRPVSKCPLQGSLLSPVLLYVTNEFEIGIKFVHVVPFSRCNYVWAVGTGNCFPVWLFIFKLLFHLSNVLEMLRKCSIYIAFPCQKPSALVVMYYVWGVRLPCTFQS